MPIETGDLLLFLAAALSLNLTPGNDMMFVIGQSLKGGVRHGMAASLGIATGSLVHLALVALGAAVVLTQHPLLFQIIRSAGAAYLVLMAVNTLTRSSAAFCPTTVQKSVFGAWRDGAIVNLLNPKIIVFFFAFLPPFVRPELGAPLVQLVFYGLVFNAGGTLINAAVAISAAHSATFISSNVKIKKAFMFLSAAVFLVLAARMVFDG